MTVNDGDKVRSAGRPHVANLQTTLTEERANQQDDQTATQTKTRRASSRHQVC